MLSTLQRYEESKERIHNLKNEILIQDGMRKQFEETLSKVSMEKEQEEYAMEVLEKSLKIFQKVSDERNQGAKKGLETVINWALSKILTNQSYEVKIVEESDARSGKTMEVYLIDNHTGKDRSLRFSVGTMLKQVVSFLMLLTVIKFADSSKVLVIDEAFSGFEEKDTVRMFSDILVALAENDGFQVIVVEQNALISDNEDFRRIHLDLSDLDKGLQVAKTERLSQQPND